MLKKTLQVAVRSGNDMLVQLKGNQPKLLQLIRVIAQQQPPGDTHHHDQLGQRNRIESRSTSVWPVAAGRLGAKWSPVRCLIQVRRHAGSLPYRPRGLAASPRDRVVRLRPCAVGCPSPSRRAQSLVNRKCPTPCS